MNINNPTDLYHFLVGHGLQRMCSESQNFVNAMDVLTRMCACDPPAAKAAQTHACNAQYINFARVAQSYATVLLPKVNNTRIYFFVNGQLICSVGR